MLTHVRFLNTVKGSYLTLLQPFAEGTERRVHVLADQGIYSKIGQETLDRYAGMVVEGIKKRVACDALCQAIQDTGQLLSTHFPTVAGDVNELPDAVIIEKTKKWTPAD